MLFDDILEWLCTYMLFFLLLAITIGKLCSMDFTLKLSNQHVAQTSGKVHFPLPAFSIFSLSLSLLSVPRVDGGLIVDTEALAPVSV